MNLKMTSMHVHSRQQMAYKCGIMRINVGILLRLPQNALLKSYEVLMFQTQMSVPMLRNQPARCLVVQYGHDHFSFKH